MEIIGIVLICLICVCLVLFFGLLAYFVYHKRTIFIKIAHDLESKNRQFIVEKLPLLCERQPIGTRLKLLPSEQAYYSEICRLYQNKSFGLKQVKHSSEHVVISENGLPIGYNDVRRMRESRCDGVYIQTGMMYVTSHRVLVVDSALTTCFDIKQIVNLELAILNIANHYYQGFILYLSDCCYRVVCNDLQLAYQIEQSRIVQSPEVV